MPTLAMLLREDVIEVYKIIKGIEKVSREMMFTMLCNTIGKRYQAISLKQTKSTYSIIHREMLSYISLKVSRR